MAEPLKNLLSREFVNELARDIRKTTKKFDDASFIKTTLKDWNQLELKDRTNRIATSFHRCIPGNYEQQLQVLLSIHESYKGLPAFVFPAFVEHYGIDFPEASFSALEHFTQRSTGEFAIRPFIRAHRKITERQILKWTKHSNEHIRRLSSEGIRPLLPWASPLREYIENPEFVLGVIERLLHDPSEYVRKSVANSMNDISKNQPEVVLSLIEKYIGKNDITDRLLHHGSRTLLKAGNKQVLKLFGHSHQIDTAVISGRLTPNSIRIGSAAQLEFNWQLNGKKKEKIRIEYHVGYKKKNGTLSYKVFQVLRGVTEPGTHSVKRKLNFTDLTTRKHLPGKHKLKIVINGVEKYSLDFNLI
jgi:3-methyladenine DNA glycosylase AlkC